MNIPTEPIGSIPRSTQLIDAIIIPGTSETDLKELYDSALSDTITKFEETGSPVITDGEQTKSSFVTYPLEGLSNLTWDGMKINF